MNTILWILMTAGFMAFLMAGVYQFKKSKSIAIVCLFVSVTALIGMFKLGLQEQAAANQKRGDYVRQTCRSFGGVANGRDVRYSEGKTSSEYYVFVCREGPRKVYSVEH